jgi:hypothetical protein
MKLIKQQSNFATTQHPFQEEKYRVFGDEVNAGIQHAIISHVE